MSREKDSIIGVNKKGDKASTVLILLFINESMSRGIQTCDFRINIFQMSGSRVPFGYTRFPRKRCCFPFGQHC